MGALPRLSGKGVRVLVTGDTHVPDFATHLPDVILQEAARADLIVHVGDATAVSVLEQLSELAPVRAVRGNNDGEAVTAWGAADSLELEAGGIQVAVLHDTGPSKGRAARMRRRFPDARVLLFGHSHIPMDIDEGCLRLVNPGSPTWKRRQPRPTFAIMTVGRGVDVDIVPIVLDR